MAVNKLETSLTIKAGVHGINKINELSKSISQAGVDVGGLTEASSELAEEFSSIERQQGLIDRFVKLKRESKETATALDEAQKATANLARQHNEARQKVADLEASVNQASQAIKEQSQAMKEAGRTTKEQRQALKEQKQTLKEQEQALSEARKQANALQRSFEQSVVRTQNLTTQQENLTNSIDRVRSAMSEAGVSTRNLYQQQQALSNRAREAEQSLQNLTNEAERLNQLAQARTTLGIDNDDNTRREIEEVTKAYERLRTSGTLTGQELTRANELHAQKVAELEAKLGQARPTMQDIASEVGNIVASAGGLAYVVKEAMKFETAMADVKKVVDGTPEQIQALSSEVQKMAVELGMSAEAVAQITAQGGQLGVPLEKLGEFTKMAGQMSVAFNMTAEEAGDAAAKMANVWNIPIDKVGELGDAINTLGNTTAAKEREIVDVMNRIGGTAKQFGLASDEAAALSAAFISLGKTPETAGTAINALLTKLSTASVQSDDFKNALANIGISADQLAKDINDNPQKALDNFLQTLGTLSKEQQSVTTFKLFGQEYVDDISLLVSGLDTYNKALGKVADKSQTAGAMQKEFEARMDTTSASLEQAKASVGVLAQTIGTHLLPIIATTLQTFTDVTMAVTDFANTYPHLTQFITIIASAQVGLTAMNSTMRLLGTTGLLSFGQVATGATTATGAITGATTATAGLNTALSATAKSAVALTGAFIAGNAIGDWAYENIDLVQTMGDHLASIPSAIHSIVTTGSLDQFVENFSMGTSRATDLKKAVDDVKTASDELAQNATANAQKQAQAHIELANNIKLTTAELESMELTLARMEASGKTGSDAHKALATEIANTKDKLELLKVEAQKQGIGESLKTDLEKASESFKTLGLDIKEFETGVSSEATTALNAFVEVAKLAGDDTDKLARAYNAVKEKIGESAEAQEMLNFKLAQATNGNKELAQSVKDTATAQQNAKKSADEQARALDALGVSMSAINVGMSQNGQKMADNLKVGLSVIKDTAKGADELKTALNQALDTAIASAKTQNDFKAIQDEINKAGLTAQVSAEQMSQIQAGANGGALGVKELNDKLKEQSETLANNDKALTQSTRSTKELDKAQKDAAKSADELAKASQNAGSATQNGGKSFAQGLARIAMGIKSQINAMTSMGATSEQINQVFDRLGKEAGKTRRSIRQLGEYFGELDKLTKKTVKSMTDMDRAVTDATHSLSGQNLTLANLAKAQETLSRATAFSIGGLIKLDKTKLSALKEQIKQAQKQMDDFSRSAKTTMQDLDAELASLQGREMDSQRIKGAQKLADLQAKMAQAVARGNSEEIAHYSKALSLQKQINDEQNRQASNKATEQAMADFGWVDKASGKSTNLTATDVVNGWNARLEQAKNQAKIEAKQEFAKELMDASKRQAY